MNISDSANALLSMEASIPCFWPPLVDTDISRCERRAGSSSREEKGVLREKFIESLLSQIALLTLAFVWGVLAGAG